MPQSYYQSTRELLLSYGKLVNSEADLGLVVELDLIPDVHWER